MKVNRGWISRSWTVRVIALAVLGFLVPAILQAQTTSGSISGTVTDTTGALIAGVSVVATKVETGSTRDVQTDTHGDFSLNSLEAGTYTLKFSSNGFKSTAVEHLILNSGSKLAVPPVSLQAGAVSETVMVRAQGAEVATTSSDRNDLLSSRQLSDLVVRGRNFTDLTTLSTGVINTSKSTDISTNPSIYVNGNRNTANAIFIDGVPSNDMSSTQMKGMVSQDAISEVKIETSNFQAEYGRNAGSNIVAVTKSGTQKLHGLLSYFNRNEDYNANNYFNNLNGIARPRYRYNTITYNIGGPVVIPGVFRNRNRDKLFFFFNQEFWPTRSTSTGNVTVPTQLERNGDFSQSAIKLTNPGSSTVAASQVISAGAINPNGQALLNVFPLPNFTNTAVSKGAYNYVFTTPVKLPINTTSAKADYHPTQNDTISGTYGGFKVNDTGALGIPDAGSQNIPLAVKTYFTHSNFVTGRWLRVFTPALLNEASFGFLQQNAGDIIDNSELQKIVRSNVGFNTGQFYPGANPSNVLPNTTFGGITSAAVIGVESRFPLVNHYHLYNFTDNVSYTRGRHNFKAGIYLEKYDRYQKTQSGVNFNGLFDFTPSTANPSSIGNAYANALTGTFNSYKETSTAGLFNLLDHDTEGYLQDNWRVTQRLTLDLGVRFAYITPFTEAANNISGFVQSAYSQANAAVLIRPAKTGTTRVGQDPGNGQLYPAAAIGGISPSTGSPSSGMVTGTNHGTLPNSLQANAGLKWGPRVGFAYDVFGNGSMAIRGGFGLFQNRFQENYFDNLVALPPLAQTPQVFYGNLSTFLAGSGLLFPNNVYGPDTTSRVARVANYSLSVQQKVGFNTILDIAYVGTQGRHLSRQLDINAIPLGTNFLASSRDTTQAASATNSNYPNCTGPNCAYPALPAAFLRPIAGYNSILLLNNDGTSGYNALQVSLQRRFVSHVQYGVAYTWSKSLADTDTDSDTIEPIVPLRQFYRSLTTFDRTHNLVLNYIVDLPGVHNALAGSVLNHWQISGISIFQSGAPLGIAVSSSTGLDVTGTASLSPRAQLSKNPNLDRSSRTFARYFDTSAVSLPVAGTYGNASRLYLRGPGINSTDLALMKNILFRERLSIQLRFEAYNVANHTQFTTVNTTGQFNAAGVQTVGTFGQVTAARDPRQLQLSARISF